MGYYVGDDTCFFDPCPGHPRENTVAQQNPLPWFTTIRETGQMDRIQKHTQFFQQAASGNLPSVSWVMPYNGVESTRPRARRSGRDNDTSPTW